MESDKNRKRIIVLFGILLVMVFLSSLYGCLATYYGYGRAVLMPDGRYERTVGNFFTKAGGPENSRFDIPVYSSDDGSLKLSAKNTMICLKAEYDEGIPYRQKTLGIIYDVLNVVRLVTLLLLMTTIVILFFNVIKGFKTQDFFKKANVFLTRLMGWLVLGYFIIDAVAEYVNQLSVIRSGFLDGTGYEINTYVDLNAFSMISAIVLFIFAELFSVGYRMNEEQKMTI